MSTVVVLASAGQLRPMRPLRVRSDPFTLGVASGDPHPDSVMLWTRLAPRPLEPGGGMVSRPVDVDWQVSDAPCMRRIVASGRVRTRPDHAHAVHVAASGLHPAGEYWYRFRCESWLSPIGRTRTAPARGQRVGQLSWATASCQAWEDGLYTAHRHLAAEEVDVVFFLGDYIYERTIGPSVRAPVDERGEGLADEATTLERYRLRYGLYKSDPDLQAAHHAAPWMVTCDDHEVEDGYAGMRPGSGPVDGFARRRHAAYQAFWEHQPVRGGPPRGPSLRLHRRATYGDLATFHVLDTRQHRSTTRAGPSTTMLGRDQERWLAAGIDRSTTRWNVVAQQVLAGTLDFSGDDDVVVNADSWDGYPVAQQRLHDDLARSKNPVVLSGDVHAAYALDIAAAPGGQSVAVELATTSISSGGDGAALLPSGRTLRAANAHLHHADQRRGYLRCLLTPDALTAEFRSVAFVERPGAPVSTERSFVVADGDTRLVPTPS